MKMTRKRQNAKESEVKTMTKEQEIKTLMFLRLQKVQEIREIGNQLKELGVSEDPLLSQGRSDYFKIIVENGIVNAVWYISESGYWDRELEEQEYSVEYNDET
jgi:hypothetical protein